MNGKINQKKIQKMKSVLIPRYGVLIVMKMLLFWGVLMVHCNFGIYTRGYLRYDFNTKFLNNILFCKQLLVYVAKRY